MEYKSTKDRENNNNNDNFNIFQYILELLSRNLETEKFPLSSPIIVVCCQESSKDIIMECFYYSVQYALFFFCGSYFFSSRRFIIGSLNFIDFCSYCKYHFLLSFYKAYTQYATPLPSYLRIFPDL